METIEYVFSIFIFGVIGFALGYLSAGVKAAQKAKKALATQQKTEEIFQSENIPQHSKTKISSFNINQIAREIILQSDEKQESFLKTLKQANLSNDVSEYDVFRKILVNKSIIYFDEVVDLLRDGRHFLAMNIAAEQREGHFLSDEDLLFILSKTGNKYFSKMLKDKNFEDNNALRILNIIDDNFLTDDPVIEYFIIGDGVKHWDNPEAEKFIILILSILPCETDENLTEKEKAFLKYFSEEKEIIEKLSHLKNDDFSELLPNYGREKLEKIMDYLKIEKPY